MTALERNGISINYSVEGSGPTVMAISGFMSTVATSQFRLVPGLPGRFRLVHGDHRGAGDSDAPPGAYSIEQIADDWVAIMDAEGIERAPVMGNSMGSVIAQSIVLRYPERVSKLVLSVPLSHSDEFLRALVGHWTNSFENMGSLEFAVQALLWTLAPGNFNRMYPLLLPLIEKNPPVMSLTGFKGQAAALMDFDLRDQLSCVEVPTLIVAGAEDKVCPPCHGEQLAALIPGAELILIRGSGHLPQTETPEAYAEAVIPFLER